MIDIFLHKQLRALTDIHKGMCTNVSNSGCNHHHHRMIYDDLFEKNKFNSMMINFQVFFLLNS